MSPTKTATKTAKKSAKKGKAPQAQAPEQTALTAVIPWNVEEFDIARDGRHLAFTTNEDGIGKLYMLDLASRKFHAETHRDVLFLIVIRVQQPGGAQQFDVAQAVSLRLKARLKHAVESCLLLARGEFAAERPRSAVPVHSTHRAAHRGQQRRRFVRQRARGIDHRAI